MISAHVIGLSLTTLGEIILAGSVISVHLRLKQEHRIDKYVINEITSEEIAGGISILLILVGYLLQLNFFSHIL